jgi:hypothetical protein
MTLIHQDKKIRRNVKSVTSRGPGVFYIAAIQTRSGVVFIPRHDMTEITKMKTFAYAALLTGFGALSLAGTLATSVPASAKCMVDEGNGRYTPCSALYSSKKCMVDEGNGRYTPCSALVKQQKKTAKQ